MDPRRARCAARCRAGPARRRVGPRCLTRERPSGAGPPLEMPRPSTAPPAVVVLVGVGGVGKTALAVDGRSCPEQHLPRRHPVCRAGRRPVGRRRPAPHRGPVPPSPGGRARSIPSRLDERLALYRSCTAGRRVLMVLDGAVAESQVLPAAAHHPGAGAIVTSRSKLAGLVGVAPAHRPAPARARDAAALIAAAREPRVRGRRTDRPARPGQRTLRTPAAGPVRRRRRSSRPTRRSTVERPRGAADPTSTRALDELSAGDIDVRAEHLRVPRRSRRPVERALPPGSPSHRQVTGRPGSPASCSRPDPRESQAQPPPSTSSSTDTSSSRSAATARTSRATGSTASSAELASERLDAEERQPRPARPSRPSSAMRWLGLARVASEALQSVATRPRRRPRLWPCVGHPWRGAAQRFRRQPPSRGQRPPTPTPPARRARRALGPSRHPATGSRPSGAASRLVRRRRRRGA